MIALRHEHATVPWVAGERGSKQKVTAGTSKSGGDIGARVGQIGGSSPPPPLCMLLLLPRLRVIFAEHTMSFSVAVSVVMGS